ncbi:MAG TPA: bluetail domain-containing putative surface protein [Trichocoleus sp.]|jgi:Ca2+-binding RTX toxin-like protein
MPSFTYLNPTPLGQFKGAWIYQFNLADSGLTSIQSITVEDDNLISGGLGSDSGADIDWVQISSTPLGSLAGVATLPNLNTFTFADSSVFFQPGLMAPKEGQTQLLGTIGDKVNFQFATLDQLDSKAGTGANDGTGRISIGEGGRLGFALNRSIATSGSYLYIAETGTLDKFQVTVSSDATPVSNPNQGIDLSGTGGNDVIDLTQGSNQIAGRRDDLINGGAGNDTIRSGPGNDTLVGGLGDDILDGGDGNDILVGGAGADILTGGLGADRFVFSGVTKQAALRSSTLKSMDQITDFQFKQGDRFQLDFDNNLTTTELPKRLFNAGKRRGSLQKVVRQVYRDKDLKQSNAQSLLPNEAVFFSIGKKTYLSVNDGKRSFSVQNDLIADVTGIQFKPRDPSKQTLVVSNYFV